LIRRFDWALVAGTLALGLIAASVGGALGALLKTATGETEGLAAALHAVLSDAYLARVVRFTLWQALLSTVLAVGLAVPVARALARRQEFPGRALLLNLFGLPLVVPGIVAVLGIVAVCGRNGLVNDALAILGLPRALEIYGLTGILIAHVFFNLPLATRLLLNAWNNVPAETWRLASQLGMDSGAIFRVIEWPLLRQALPGVAGLVFMLCVVSFTVVLTLGGGPAATTIELAIYHALRFDFEPVRAAGLALVQFALCGALLAACHRLVRPMAMSATTGRWVGRPDLVSAAGRIFDFAVIAAAMLVVALPLGAVVAGGLAGPVAALLDDRVLWRALALSLGIGIAAAALALMLGAGLLGAARHLRRRMGLASVAGGIEWSGAIILVVPPFVIGTGWFVLLHRQIDVFAVGPFIVIAINALMALPYVMHGLAPALARADELHDRLCQSLGILGWTRLRLIDWPLLRRPVGLALALATALSFGDLGAIALFGNQDTTTLPLLLYQRLGSYRTDEAAVIALILAALSLGLFALVERGIGGAGPSGRGRGAHASA